ncbi:hypothetical protein PFDSM3638_07690 [Pyrococcus furiosus DSM 3638]|uniref:Uncharacterized protein n=3 Tax=Pyrococcus TaxID=2260 RepID=Q8U0Q7_PYRFU|nr:hypothetical protein PF1527 [Pyrococcus furiosus DSM 3638]MDK2869027.1 hypothetical protein [Pyrococcus sp.]QEK79151.1 hypothetical protein PFDSM3638_07690 [Pyrococcus furiosus DSM 3638]
MTVVLKFTYRLFSVILLIILVVSTYVNSRKNEITPELAGHGTVTKLLGKWVDTADSVSYARVSISRGYGSAYLSFDVSINGKYGVVAAAASGYSLTWYTNGDKERTVFSPLYLLEVRSKDYDSLEKDVRYYKT